MSGHSKWSQIKHKKAATDKQRGQIFSKLLKAISIAAKSEPNPQFNPRLRSAIEKARENQVPQDNIERAIKRASEAENNLEELLMEAYGPEGAAILIEAITDNRNRTISETKTLLKDFNAKWAEPGSVLWAFEQKPGQSQEAGAEAREDYLDYLTTGESKWFPKFPQKISAAGEEKVKNLLEALDNHDDIEGAATNVAIEGQAQIQ